MAQPLLALQHRSGAAPQVYRMPGASPTPFGDPIGVAIEGASADQMAVTNRVIQFQGDVYCAVNGGVYKKDDPTSETGPWSLDHAFTNFTAQLTKQHLIFGPYQFVENGIPKLFVCWLTATGASTWNASILNGNTNVWSDVGEQAGASTVVNELVGHSIVYRGVLYTLLSGSQVQTFDPSAASFGTLSSPMSPGYAAGMGIFNDRLFLFGRNTATGFLALAEVSGTISVLFDTAFVGDNTLTEGKYLLVPSPTGSALYGIAYTTTGGNGNVFLKFIDTAGTISYSTDLTNTVMPVALRPGGGGGTLNDRWWAFYDQETTPGTAVLNIFFSVGGNAGNTVTQYSFVDEVTLLSQDDIGGSAAWAFSSIMTGGGERIFTSGELHVEIVDRLAVFGGEAIRFKAWGLAGADKFVDFRFNTQTEVPLTQATLIGTPTIVSGGAPAPVRNVNTLENVTADGTTVYQTIWDIATDGLVAGQRAQLVPRIYV